MLILPGSGLSLIYAHEKITMAIPGCRLNAGCGGGSFAHPAADCLHQSLPEPASGGIYTEALVGSFGRLNPLLDLNNPADRDVDRLLFSSLLKFDSHGVPQPDLAESWGVSADGTIYNLTLAANATWHDGSPVTSDDVIFTLDLLRSQSSAYSTDVRTLWDGVEITRLNDKNLKFALKRTLCPIPGLPDIWDSAQTPPGDRLGRPIVKLTAFNLAPVGSGPYKFDHLMVRVEKLPAWC